MQAGTQHGCFTKAGSLWKSSIQALHQIVAPHWLYTVLAPHSRAELCLESRAGTQSRGGWRGALRQPASGGGCAGSPLPGTGRCPTPPEPGAGRSALSPAPRPGEPCAPCAPALPLAPSHSPARPPSLSSVRLCEGIDRLSLELTLIEGAAKQARIQRPTFIL